MRRKVLPAVLVLSSRYDFSCDFVISELRRLGTPYFRLNYEDFDQYAITMVPDSPEVHLINSDFTVALRPDHLRSVYYRVAVYPREPKTDKHSLQEQLIRAHRSAFMRSFMIFDSCLWVNSPAATYAAEHKAAQLIAASRLGFAIPRTVITNDISGVRLAAGDGDNVAVKGLDTVLVWRDGFETFGYTSLIPTSSAIKAYLSSAPLIAQEPLEDKIDIRVTVVGEKAFAVSITDRGNSIQGDWRLRKTEAEIRQIELPSKVTELCLRFTKFLDLQFGAIDLALQDGEYFFLEINPTGEWGWLMDAELPIDKALAEVLSGA